MLIIEPQDIAVRSEGLFHLKYRCFDLFSESSDVSQDSRILSELNGAAFRVYSSKNFPGLKASTELTMVGRLVRV
jgi:hypothetical protein